MTSDQPGKGEPASRTKTWLVYGFKSGKRMNFYGKNLRFLNSIVYVTCHFFRNYFSSIFFQGEDTAICLMDNRKRRVLKVFRKGVDESFPKGESGSDSGIFSENSLVRARLSIGKHLYL